MTVDQRIRKMTNNSCVQPLGRYDATLSNKLIVLYDYQNFCVDTIHSTPAIANDQVLSRLY